MSISNLGIADTKAAGAAVSAPTASATIVTLGVLPAGTYRVSAVIINTGTAETALSSLTNMGLYHGSTLVSGLPTIGSPVRQEFERITVNGSESIAIKAIAAAIAGSVYVASLSAVKVGA